MILVTTKERILQYLDFKGINRTIFYEKTTIKRGFLDSDKLKSSVSDIHLAIIIATFPDLNIEWVITGNGEMINQKSNDKNIVQESSLVEYLKNDVTTKENKIFELLKEIGSLNEKIKGLQAENWRGKDAQDATAADVG